MGKRWRRNLLALLDAHPTPLALERLRSKEMRDLVKLEQEGQIELLWDNGTLQGIQRSVAAGRGEEA